MSNHIFVYGTLKKGGINNSILDNCVFIGLGRVWGCALLDYGGYPGMIPTTVRGGDISSVRGEVYAVPDRYWPGLLNELDRLEQAFRLYIRVKIRVDVAGTAKECTTYLFMATVNQEDIIQGGVWGDEPHVNGGP